MARWTTITIDDLNDTKVAALVTALRTKALADGQDDPTPEIIADAIAQIRSEVAGCKTNHLDVDATKIPNSLKSLGGRMIVRELMSRLQEPLNTDERKEKEDDLRRLERIAKCEAAVENADSPQVPTLMQKGGGAELCTANPMITSAKQMDGIV